MLIEQQIAARQERAAAAPNASDVELAAASFLEAGMRFIESIAAGSAAGSSNGVPTIRLGQVLSSMFTKLQRR